MQNRRGAITLAFLCACSGKVIDIGSNQNTGGSSGNGGAASNMAGSGNLGGYGAGGTVGVGGTVGGGGNFGPGGSIGVGGNAGDYGWVDAGNGGSVGYGGAAGAAGGVATPWPVDSDCQSGTQLPIVGTWDGYIENYMFASGSDAIHVKITAANSTRVCGKVSFGDGMPLPAPTDPNVGYPPSLVESAARSGAAGGPNFEAEAENYPMTILNGQSTTARIQFQVDTKELWKGWCELERPYSHAGIGYSCAPDLGWGGGGGGPCTLSNGQVIDCAKMMLCTNNVCSCTATACTVSPAGDISFDLHVQSATQLSGSATLSGLHNVYLDRAP